MRIILVFILSMITIQISYAQIPSQLFEKAVIEKDSLAKLVLKLQKEKEDINELQKLYDALSVEKQEIQQKYSQLEKSVSGKDASIVRLETEVKTKNAQITELKKEKVKLNNDLKKVNNGNLKTENKRLKTEVEKQKGYVETWKRQANNNKEKFLAANKEIKELQEYKTKAASKDREIDALRTKKDSEIKGLKEQINQLENIVIKGKDNKITQLENEITKLENEVEIQKQAKEQLESFAENTVVSLKDEIEAFVKSNEFYNTQKLIDYKKEIDKLKVLTSDNRLNKMEEKLVKYGEVQTVFLTAKQLISRNFNKAAVDNAISKLNSLGLNNNSYFNIEKNDLAKKLSTYCKFYEETSLVLDYVKDANTSDLINNLNSFEKYVQDTYKMPLSTFPKLKEVVDKRRNGQLIMLPKIPCN